MRDGGAHCREMPLNLLKERFTSGRADGDKRPKDEKEVQLTEKRVVKEFTEESGSSDTEGELSESGSRGSKGSDRIQESGKNRSWRAEERI